MIVRIIVAAFIAWLVLMVCLVAFLTRPIGESPLDPGPGVWPTNAAYTGTSQQLVCMYVYLPAQGSKRPIERT